MPLSAREDRRVDGVADDRRGGGGERAEAAVPEGVAGVLVDRLEHAVVGELEDVIAADHRRELEQRAAVVHPQPLERRVQAGGGGEEARVVLGVAVERPGEAVRAARRQARGRLGHEARVGVVDAAGAVALVQVGAEHDGEQQHEHRRQAEEDSLGAERGASDALRP